MKDQHLITVADHKKIADRLKGRVGELEKHLSHQIRLRDNMERDRDNFEKECNKYIAKLKAVREIDVEEIISSYFIYERKLGWFKNQRFGRRVILDLDDAKRLHKAIKTKIDEMINE